MFCRCKGKVELLEYRVACLEKAHGNLLKALLESNHRELEAIKIEKDSKK